MGNASEMLEATPEEEEKGLFRWVGSAMDAMALPVSAVALFIAGVLGWNTNTPELIVERVV